jgi:organic radical activating enzyme
MPPINILIKPASSACNMACQYCFYKDVAAHREQEFEGMLSIESIEKVIQAGMEYAEHICSFAFQGGEPTLAGLDFYRQVVVLQKQYAKPGVEIRNAIQTNGYTIDEEWAAWQTSRYTTAPPVYRLRYPHLQTDRPQQKTAVFLPYRQQPHRLPTVLKSTDQSATRAAPSIYQPTSTSCQEPYTQTEN